MKPMMLIVSLLCLVACGGSGNPGMETCEVSAAHPYNVTHSSLPLAGFQVDPADPAESVCYAPDGNLRDDTCGISLFQRCGPRGDGDFTYCPSPSQQVEYWVDPFTGEERLFCQLR